MISLKGPQLGKIEAKELVKYCKNKCRVQAIQKSAQY